MQNTLRILSCIFLILIALWGLVAILFGRAHVKRTFGIATYLVNSLLMAAAALLSLWWSSWWPFLWLIGLVFFLKPFLNLLKFDALGDWSSLGRRPPYFDGMAIRPSAVFLAGGLLTTGAVTLSVRPLAILCWVLLSVLLLLFRSQADLRFRCAWGLLHYPLLYRYAIYEAQEMAASEHELRPFDRRAALYRLLEGTIRARDTAELDAILKRARSNRLTFADEPALRELIGPHAGDFVSKLRELVINDEKLDTSYTIAELVAAAFGPDERVRYLSAVFHGHAV